MENKRTFEITDLAGENLENVRWHGFMTVYAIVSSGGKSVTTEVDYVRETNPKWDTPIKFTLHDPSIHSYYFDLDIQFFCDRTFTSDKYIAGFRIPVKRLFDKISGNVESSQAVRYPVVNSDGREHGFVKFSYKFGELPKPNSQQQLSSLAAQPKPTSQLPPQQRPPSQPPSSQQPQPSQRPKRQPQSPEQPPPQQQLPSQPPSSQQPRPLQRPKRQPQSPEYPPPQEPRPSSQSTQQPRLRPQPPPQQQGPPPQPTPSSGQQQLRPQQSRPPPRPQQQQYPQQARPSPPQQQPYPQQARPPPPRPQQRPYPQQARPPPPRPRPRPRPPPQSTQNAAAFRAQFVATGQVQVSLSENSPNPHENPPEPALDNHIDQLNTSVEAEYGIDPDHDNSIPGDIQSEHPENEAYCQMTAPEYENNENNHNRDEYQDNEEGYGNNEEGYGYDGVDNGGDYGDGEEFIEEGYQDDGVNNGEDYGGGEGNYDDEEGYEDEGNEEDCGGEEEDYEEEEEEEEG